MATGKVKEYKVVLVGESGKFFIRIQ